MNEDSGIKLRGDNMYVHERPTIIYDAMKLRKGCSERGAIISGESERFTKALNASWATL